MGVFDDVDPGNVAPGAIDPDDVDDTDDDPDGNDTGRTNRGDEGDDTGENRRRRNRPGSVRRDRDRVRQLESKLDTILTALQGGGLATNPPKNGQVDPAKLRAEIEAEVTSKIASAANVRIVESRAEAALERAGFRGDALRGIRLLDLEGIDGNDRNAILDAIDDLKEESPELFGRVRRNRSSRDSGRDRDDYSDDPDDGQRQRDSRPTQSRERMTRSNGNGGGETDSLAETLIRAVGGSRDTRR